MDKDSLLSPALLKHKDLGASGHKMSHKNEKNSLNVMHVEQVCLRLDSHVTRVSLTGVKQRCRPPSLTCMKVFLQVCESFGPIRRPVNSACVYCHEFELPDGWRLMERHEKQKKEP